MRGKFFLDTNIFVYSFDRRAGSKQGGAQGLIESALSTRLGVISTQVIQEFLNVATTKFAKPLTVHDSARYLDMVLAPLCEVYASLALYRTALHIQEETAYSFYDSLIIAAAIHADCRMLYSENFYLHRRARDQESAIEVASGSWLHDQRVLEKEKV